MNILLEDSEHEELCGERTDPGRMGRIVSDAIASGKALMNGESYFVEQDNEDISYDPQADEFDHEPLAKEFYFRSTISPYGLVYFTKQTGMDYTVSVVNGHTLQNETWYTKTEMIRNVRQGIFVVK